MTDRPEFRAGFCGLIGQPNAGKSSLLNWLVQEKISIVTSKPQTTRRRVLGLWTEDKGQIVFVDAPGVLKNQKGLNAFLENEAMDVISSSDVLIAVLSLDEERKENLDEVVKLASASGRPYIILVNKIDLQGVDHRKTLLRRELSEKYPEVPAFFVSTQGEFASAEVRTQIREWILSKLPVNAGPLYEADLLTPHTMKEISAEFIRESCFLNLHQEIPYGMAVRVLKFEESDTLYRIYADLVVSKSNHKSMVIGRGGSVIKSIGQSARTELEKFFQTKVYLELTVVVRENWSDSKAIMKEFGYVSS